MSLTRRSLTGLMSTIALSSLVDWNRPTTPRSGTTAEADDLQPPAALDAIPAAAREVDKSYGIVVELADIGLELDHTAIALPDSLQGDAADREAYLGQLAVVSTTGGAMVQFALAPDWRDLHGFDIRDVDQILQYGLPPDRVTILQGRFDLDAITSALTDQGYDTIDIAGVTVLNGGEDYEVDLDSDIDRFWVGKAQNVALIDESRIVLAAARSSIEASVRAGAGDEPSLGADDEIAALFPATAGPLTTAVVLNGRALSSDRFEATVDDDVPLLPRVRLAVFGSTPGGIGLGQAGEDRPDVPYDLGENQIRILFADADAATAGRDAMAARLEAGFSFRTGQPWPDLLGQIDIDRPDDSALVIVHIPDWIPGQRRVTDLVYNDDLGFLIWE